MPFDVRMVSIAPGGDAWRPTAVDMVVSEAAERSAENLQVFIRKLETGANFASALQTAQAQQQVILLVADASMPADPLLNTLNGLPLSNLAVLLVDAGKPAVGLDAWLAAVGGGACAAAKNAGMVSLAGPGELQTQMERLICDARRRLQIAVPPAKAEDAALSERAKAQGISADLQPTLAGPGTNP